MAISVDNYLNCCRICLGLDKSDFFLDIENNQLPETDVSIRTALQKTTGIECPSDTHLPSRICQSCQLRLQDAYNFITEFCNNTVLLESLKQKAIQNAPSLQEIIVSFDKELNAQENTPCNQKISVTERDVSSECEVLHIERLEATSSCTEIIEDYVHFDTSDGESKSSEEQGHKDFENNPESDNGMADENATDAVDFILQNLKSAHKNKKKYEHSALRRYQCEVCEKSFQRKSNLVDHLRLHANVKLFACSYCNAAFVQAGNLKSHIRKHTLEKPYKCQYCDKSYSQSSALKTHVRSHTNTRDYICDICNKGFTNRSDLNKHKLTHSDLRFYKCAKCDKRFFTQKVHLKKHIRTLHPDENLDELLQLGILKDGVCINSVTKEK